MSLLDAILLAEQPINVYVNYPNKLNSVSLKYDQHSGKQLASIGWDEKTGLEKVWAFNYDIHVGAIGGIVGKTIAFFLSLFSASLPVTGFIIWWGRRNKRKKAENPKGKGKSSKKVPLRPKMVRSRPKVTSTID